MKKLLDILFYLIIFLFLSIFLSVFSEYHFYSVEQNQLFQISWPSISEMLMKPGGLALVITESLVQFFIVPYAGAVITAALLTLIGLLTSMVLRHIDPKTHLFILPLLPVLTLLFVHFDNNYILQGTIALGMMLLILYGVLKIKPVIYRLVASLVATILLFFFAGAVFSLFALAVILCEVINRTSYWYYFFCTGFIALLLGIGSVYFSFIGEYRFAFLPDAYYHVRLVPDKVIYYSWLSFLLSLLIVFILRHKNELKGKMLVIVSAIQILLICFLFWKGVEKYGDSKSYQMKTMDYYARTEQWDKILEMCRKPMTNYLYMCYANMALAHKGQLADDAFKYDQRGPQGLAVTWNKSANVSTLLSDVYFAMGNVAIAQEMAFESNLGSLCDGNPRMMKRLVQTNLIYGTYPVAEKYIAVLENTLYYRDWAKEQRKFLYNDAEVESDPLLGNMRKGLLTNSILSQIDGFDADLRLMAEQNPANKAAFQYLGVFYLLMKDMDKFKNMIETYYGTEFLPVLPTSYQEAVITLSERESDYWKRFGVSESIVKRFDEYKRQVLANRNNPNALPGLLGRSYGDTYWFYYMFK